ncbi:MAG: alanine racemase, partial [Desulfosalsimonas sp.]
ALVRDAAGLEHVRVHGLMTMPPFFDAPEKVRPYFRQLAQLREQIAAQNIAGAEMRELSMGMTGDFETAIAEGATLVRIGTAIFGERT